MDWSNPIDRLDLDDQAVVHHEIQLVMTVKFETLLPNRQLLLTVMMDTRLPKLEAQTFLIGALEQSGPKMTMHLDGNAYNLLGQNVIWIWVQEGSVCSVALWCSLLVRR